MDILGILKLLLLVADKVAGYLNTEQLLDAGKAINTAENLRGALDALAKAHAAVAAVRANPDGVRSDPYNDDLDATVVLKPPLH